MTRLGVIPLLAKVVLMKVVLMKFVPVKVLLVRVVLEQVVLLFFLCAKQFEFVGGAGGVCLSFCTHIPGVEEESCWLRLRLTFVMMCIALLGRRSIVGFLH
jgi:hypothetical protein